MPHRQLKHDEIKEKFSNLRQAGALPLVLIANNIGDPRNLGALFRLADAAGVGRIYLIGGAPANEERIRRVARSTNRHIQVQAIGQAELIALKEEFDLVALEITSDSIPYTEYRPERAVALIIGNEKKGIEPDVLQWIDQAVHIPMYGMGNSMNAAMAAGIATYGLMRNFR